jgi:NAD(P)H dehydrogenase (quinone)
MKALLVLAHPEPASFNGSLHRVAVETLTADGHEVQVSDLYAMAWNPVAGPGDVTGTREDPDVFRLDREQTHAHEAGTVAPEIVAEQEKVSWADLLLLQYPMWWFGPPAILKGWFDRVFTRGFGYLPGRKYDTGLMHGKTAMVAVTTGTSADTYAPDGVDGALLDVMWPVHNGLLRYTGFDVLEPFAVHAPGRLEPAQRTAILEQYAAELRAIESRSHLFFHARSDYGPDERLLPDVEPRSGFQHRDR